MKFVPTVFPAVLLGGALLLSPMAARRAFAQSSTTSGGAAAKPQTPSGSAATAPSNRKIGSLTPGQPAPPEHPITLAQTRELLDLMNYKKIEDSNWSQMIAMNKQQAPFIPEDVWTDVQSNVSSIDYPALMQPIYAKYLSQEDAEKALVFYRTPAGKRVLQSMPPLLGESVAASQQKGRQLGRDAIEKHRPEIEAAQKKYQEEHPPQGAGGPGNGSGAPGQMAPGQSAPGQSAPGQSASPSTTPGPATPPPSATKPQR